MSSLSLLPNGLLLNWGRMSPLTSGGDYDPTTVTFRRSFGSTPFYCHANYEKADSTRDAYNYGFIYTGTARTDANPDTSGVRSTDVTFARWSEFRFYWIAIGTA